MKEARKNCFHLSIWSVSVLSDAFWSKNTPAMFQRLVKLVLGDLHGHPHWNNITMTCKLSWTDCERHVWPSTWRNASSSEHLSSSLTMWSQMMGYRLMRRPKLYKHFPLQEIWASEVLGDGGLVPQVCAKFLPNSWSLQRSKERGFQIHLDTWISNGFWDNYITPSSFPTNSWPFKFHIFTVQMLVMLDWVLYWLKPLGWAIKRYLLLLAGLWTLLRKTIQVCAWQ